MKTLIIILIPFLFPIFTSGQILNRLENELPEQFAKRIQPEHTEIVHKVIDTNWNSLPVIIAFYRPTDHPNYRGVIAKLYIQAEQNQYKSFLIDTINCEGGEPQIESVFFTNADIDKAKELILIVSWEQRHFDTNGTLYGTYVYDDLLSNSQMKLDFMSEISKKLDGGFEGSREGDMVIAKFKTPESIIAELEKLGFN